MSDEISEKELADLKIDENEDESTNYKAPAKKTIDELNQLDAEDESLRKYKEVFLHHVFPQDISIYRANSNVKCIAEY